jgi:hypothetical protein
MPIVFVESDSTSVTCVWSLTNNNNGTWTAIVTKRNSSNVQSLTATIYVFANRTSAPATGYGMQTFDSSGGLTFDASERILKISGLFVCPIGGSLSSAPAEQDLTFGTIPTSYACSGPAIGFVDTGLGVPASRSPVFQQAVGRGTTNTKVRIGNGVFVGSSQLVFEAVLPLNFSAMFIDTSLYQ